MIQLEYTEKRRKRVKLIFNPQAGKNRESPAQLMDVIKQMQKWKLVPEPFMIEPGCGLEEAVREALDQGIRLFAVCGGDGTVSSAARALMGQKATLGIIPTGTHNNVALSLGIPTDIAKAIAILRTGRRIKIDLGVSSCGGKEIPFIEVCSVGLLPELFAAGDDIQHGKLTRIGDFMGTLLATQVSRIRLLLEDRREVLLSGHVALVSNTPYILSNNRVGTPKCFRDGLLDITLFTDPSKLNLIGHVLRESAVSELGDPGVLRYRVHKALIETTPAMPVMADSDTIGAGSVGVEIKKGALAVMVADAAVEEGRCI